ncbi:hypothetical protein JZ751_009630 [Albula glossodonta]|uniref:Uncharacterized protein n=1 Tax=Albula glossodonta TaxID=121402 RepID=A0A8T2NYA6_9TELE|nr:hypothetical protein JZ751_009630 [Albula glossodonta]
MDRAHNCGGFGIEGPELTFFLVVVTTDASRFRPLNPFLVIFSFVSSISRSGAYVFFGCGHNRFLAFSAL